MYKVHGFFSLAKPANDLYCNIHLLFWKSGRNIFLDTPNVNLWLTKHADISMDGRKGF